MHSRVASLSVGGVSMTIERLKALAESLEIFRDWNDELDSHSIANARTIYLANKLEFQHHENREHIDFVLRWIRAKIPPGPPPF